MSAQCSPPRAAGGTREGGCQPRGEAPAPRPVAHDAHEGYREYTDRCGYTRSRTLAPGHTQALAPSLWHLSALSGPHGPGEPTFAARRDTAAQSDMAQDRQQKRCSTRTPGRPPAPGYCRCPGRHAPSRAGRPRTPRPQPLTQAPPLIWLVVSSHLALVTGWLGRARVTRLSRAEGRADVRVRVRARERAGPPSRGFWGNRVTERVGPQGTPGLPLPRWHRTP